VGGQVVHPRLLGLGHRRGEKIDPHRPNRKTAKKNIAKRGGTVGLQRGPAENRCPGNGELDTAPDPGCGAEKAEKTRVL